MPYGTTNGNYICDSCKRELPEGTLAWVKLKLPRSELYCMKCKPEESLSEDKPKIKTSEKQIRVLKVLLKILKKNNQNLRRKLKNA